MADTKTTNPEPESIEDTVQVRHLTGAHENPNIPRSVFKTELNNLDADNLADLAVSDNADVPGKGFTSKSISVKAIQMKHGFTANGEIGNDGDWLAYVGGHWVVIKDENMK